MANFGEVFCGNCASITHTNRGIVESVVLLGASPMKCIKTGATQLDMNGDNMMQNLDVFECLFCKNRIVMR